MFSGQIAFYADNCVADERLVTEYEKLAAWCPSLWERLSEKSNILQWESRIRFWPCIVVRSILVSRGLLGQPGGGRLSKWSNISKWKSRICFRQCIGIRTISLLLGLLRQSGFRPSWQTWFSVLCWTSSFYGNRGMPRGASERGSWQVDHAVRILYDIDV